MTPLDIVLEVIDRFAKRALLVIGVCVAALAAYFLI